MTRDPEPIQASHFSPAWLQRVNTTLALVLLLVVVGFGMRAVSQRVAGEVSVPGIYVKVRPERGGAVEARALPAAARRAAGPPISLDVELVGVADLVRLVEEASKVRAVVLCPGERRVSLRARGAPVESVLEAVAAAANLTFAVRDATFALNGCAAPPAP